jgi:signal transduction histidine kinase/CheY-like chemotaxis protein
MILKKQIVDLIALPRQAKKSGIDHFRQRLLHYLLLGFAIFGFIAYLPSIYYSFLYKFYGIAFLDTLILGAVFLLAIKQQISFFNKSLGLLSLFYILGVGLLIFLGPNGAGFLWLLMFSIMTGVLLGVRPALISLGINLVTLLALSLFVHNRALPWQQLQLDPMSIWVVVSVNFICINAVAALSVAFLINKITQMVQAEKIGRIRLEDEIQTRIHAERENKELLRKLYHSQKMEAMGTLAGGVAHDFNNILGAILGYAELSLLDLDKAHPVHENLEHICQASERGKGIVHQILSFSRQTPSHKEACDLCQIIQECVNFFKIALPGTIELTTTFPDTPLLILADKTKLFQVIMNLLTNAMHAIELDHDKEKGKGKISLGAHFFPIAQKKPKYKSLEPGNYIELTVEDTGCGIQKDEIPRIFEPYFTTKKIDKGTGMGLSIAHGIIRDHGGEIMVSSMPGKGSCFMVYLTCHTPLTIMEKTKEIKKNPRGKGTILFVDDEPELVEIYTRFLENFGYQAIGFTDSLAAKKQFEKTPYFFDIVITDKKMPGLTGDLLAIAIKKTNPDIPIILCSGFTELSDENIFDKVLIKPVSSRVLAEQIQNLLSAAAEI